MQWTAPGSGQLGRTTPAEVYLVIEFADSSLAYDQGAKLARYAAAGQLPAEVWVANLRTREVTAYADPSDSEYAAVRVYRAGDSISPQAFPDVTLAVDDFIPTALPRSTDRTVRAEVRLSAPKARTTVAVISSVSR